MWTKSACVVLAWSIVLILVAVGMTESVRATQANIRIARSTTQVTLASTLSVAAARRTAADPATRYVVRPGDTLSGIAARFAVRGGWPALYVANRSLIGPDPDVIHAGIVLVLPGRMAPVRYTVVAGDTLSGIAARFAVRGGWPALYAANRPVIGPDADLIRPGTVLTVSRPVRAPVSFPGRRLYPVPPSARAGSGHRSVPERTGTPAVDGMPRWLEALLVAAGLLIAAAFLTEPLLAVRRRRRRAADAAAAPARAAEPALVPSQCPGGQPGGGRLPAGSRARIVVADHDRVVVARSQRDDMVYVLRPSGTGPGEVLRAARLVLPEELYGQLAERLGVPVSWPVVVVDHDRVVVARSQRDDMVCVLRPPGADPREVLRAARLVLPEEPYGELAEQLGAPVSGWDGTSRPIRGPSGC